MLWLLDLPPVWTGILDNAADLLCLNCKSTVRLQPLVSRCQKTYSVLYCIGICTYCDFASFLCAKGVAHQHTCVLVYRCYKEEPRVSLGTTAELHVVHKVVTVESLHGSCQSESNNVNLWFQGASVSAFVFSVCWKSRRVPYPWVPPDNVDPGWSHTEQNSIPAALVQLLSSNFLRNFCTPG